MNNCCICNNEIGRADKVVIRVGSGFTANKYFVCNNCCALIKRSESDLKSLRELNIMLDRINPLAAKAVSTYFHVKDESQLIRDKLIHEEQVDIDTAEQARIDQVLLTTTDILSTHTIVRYIEPISGEAVLGKGFESEWYSSSSTSLGGENGVFSVKLKQARKRAFDKLRKECYLLGGNAVVGITVNLVKLDDNMISVMVTGTAVEIESI